MRLRLIAAVAIVLGGGFAAASPPDASPAPPPSQWTITVTDSNAERHEYVVLRGGGKIRVDAGDWRCSYDPVDARDHDGIYAETLSVTCTAGKYSTGTQLVCGPKYVEPKYITSLLITSGQKVNVLLITCVPD